MSSFSDLSVVLATFLACRVIVCFLLLNRER